jgi:3-isopropylmalate/(R)-2-methylmalate dehydratase small subunit
MDTRGVRGRAVVLRMDDVSTDHIYPVKHINVSDPAQIAEHALEGVDASIKERFTTVGPILVTGSNFGCGSSREHAVITLKEAGVKAVVASSVARIWYRNAINLALPVMICPGMVDHVQDGDELGIDFRTGRITNLMHGTAHQGQPLPEFVLTVFARGGIKPMMRDRHHSPDGMTIRGR